MPADLLSLLSELPLDTPPLSPSRSPSSTSATRSSVASSNSSLSLGDFGARMSKKRIERSGSQASAENVEPQVTSRKFPHDSVMFNGAREGDIEEEIDVDMEQGDRPRDRGRSGYDDRYDPHRRVPPSRPSVPRQGSYSKRHSSFDTPREVPFPRGYLDSSVNPLSSPPIPPSTEVQNEILTGQPVSPQESGQKMGGRMDAETTSAFNESIISSASYSPPHRPNFERSSSTSLPLPTSMPYSSLPSMVPPDSSPRYENPRPAPMIPHHSYTNTTDSGIQSSVAFPPQTNPFRSSNTKMETPSSYPLSSRLPAKSPSPPLLADEPDVTNPEQPSSSRSGFMQSYEPRPHNSLPPPPRLHSLTSLSSSPLRPASLPQVFNNSSLVSQSHTGNSSIPPPQPPTILTPPPPLSAEEESSRKPAPYEPFLPRDQPPANHTYIAVETVASEYRLIVRLPGFQRDSITLAMRRRRILHVVADNWSDGGGHFERRISFGYDADLASVRAEFDGEILKIIVPRRTLPGWYGPSTN